MEMARVQTILGPDWNRRFNCADDADGADAKWPVPRERWRISREWRQKGEFSPEPSGSQSRVRLAAQVECGLPANADHR
jgi:hypothetical protein